MSAIILQGNVIDTLKTIEARSVRCVVTSPPYFGLRSYLKDSDPLKEYEIGSEPTPELYIQKLVAVFREVWRVLSDDGNLWLNIGDSYAGSNGNGYKQSIDPVNRTNGREDERLRKTNNRVDVGYKPKDLMMIPARVAIALQADGWYLRSEIVWAKPNPMPESVKDRPTRSHEMIYLLTKSEKYYYDYEAILEPANYDGRNDTQFKGSEKYKDSGQTFAKQGHERWPRTMPKNLKPDGQQPNSMHVNRANGEGEPELFEKDGVPARNKRDVWTVTTKPYSEAHFATFPPDLIEPCILAGSAVGDTVLDPFGGSGATATVALKHHRKAILCELNNEYIPLINRRLKKIQPVLFPQ